MNKKWGLSAAALLLTAAVILPGCGSKQEAPKEALKSAATKAATMSSYELQSKFAINDLTIETANDESAAMTTQVLSMLKNADITVDGVYQAEPRQTELTLVLNLKGDMSMSFNVPMVMTAEKLYVKIPSIPFVPLPETIINKFVEVDLKALAEQEGAEFNPDALDSEKMRKFSTEVMDTVLAEYDEGKYFKEISLKDANLPEGVEAKQVVQFQVTNDNVKEALTILVNNALPKIFDILSKEEYKDMLQINAEDLAEAKKEITSSDARAEFDKGLADLDKYLTINQFHYNTAVNKDGFPVYQDILMDLKVNDPEDGTNVAFSVNGTGQFSKINDKPDFKIGIPQGDDVITMDQLEEQFGGLGAF